MAKLLIKILCIFLFLSLCLNNTYGSGVGIELLGLNMHLIDSAVEWGKRSPHKLDDGGRFLYLPGLEVYYEWDAREGKIFNADGYRFTIASYLDTMDRHSGYIHLGLRYTFPFDSGRQLSIGFGPSLFFRETWSVFPDYEKHQLLVESDSFLPGYEHMWLVFGDVDYQYRISKDLKLVVSMLPAIPYSILFSIGIL